MEIVITHILIALAAICNAVMDRVENSPAFNKSIFKDKNKEWWLKEVSWATAKRIFGYKFDAWHIFKSLMIIFLISAAFVGLNKHWYLILTGGAVWNFVFNLFYNKIFKA